MFVLTHGSVLTSSTPEGPNKMNDFNAQKIKNF